MRSLLKKIWEEDSEKAFEELFYNQHERLFRAAFYYLQNDDLAQEVTLDVLAEVWNRRHSMPIPDDFYKFTFVMVKNAALNLLAKEQHFADPSDDTPLVESLTPQQQLERDELFLRYEHALQELPERCREVFIRVKEEGMSYAEVSQIMGISTKTVDAQIQKATQHLRKKLEKYRPNIGKFMCWLVL